MCNFEHVPTDPTNRRCRAKLACGHHTSNRQSESRVSREGGVRQPMYKFRLWFASSGGPSGRKRRRGHSDEASGNHCLSGDTVVRMSNRGLSRSRRWNNTKDCFTLRSKAMANWNRRLSRTLLRAPLSS